MLLGKMLLSMGSAKRTALISAVEGLELIILGLRNLEVAVEQ
jgi:hypothetical protein